MDLEHVRSLVEARLILGTSLSLGGREAQILQSRGCRIGGRRLGLILGITLGLVRRENPARGGKLSRHGAGEGAIQRGSGHIGGRGGYAVLQKRCSCVVIRLREG